MSFIVKGMNPPRSCYVCNWYNKVECPVNDGRYYYRVQRHPNCPLVEVKEFHGDLIEREEAIKAARRADDDRVSLSDSHIMSDAFEKEIKKIATIIEAEGSEE